WAESHLDWNNLEDAEWKVNHFWDYISLNGQSFLPLSVKSTRIFETFHFSLANWSRPYNNNRYFVSAYPDRTPYTIQIGSSGRLYWYLICNTLNSNANSTIPVALESSNFMQLLSLFIHIFETSSVLSKYGINCENLNMRTLRQTYKDMTMSDWTIFQSELFNNWQSYFTEHGLWTFWQHVIPTIHLLEYGGNLSIELSENSSDISLLTDSLSSIFDAENLYSISFAIASEVSVEFVNEIGEWEHLALLASANAVSKQYHQPKKHSTIYPVAFSSDACCWQSSVPPIFYRTFEHELQSIYSDIEASIITCNSFQGYCTLDKQVRPTPADFPYGHSLYTGAYCIPESLIPKKFKEKYSKCITAASTHAPIQKFRRSIQVSEDTNNCNFRYEPVFT